MIPGLFVTGPATASGKTFISRALAGALRDAGRTSRAVKPIETGADPLPADAAALARACARPELAHAAGLYRARMPLSPYAVTLETGQPAPDLRALAACVLGLAQGADFLLVEGAGGLLVPLDERATIAELALALRLPLLLVAPDQLGVLSSVLTCVESARLRGLAIAALVLNALGAAPDDPSPRTNRRILAARLDFPVLSFPGCEDDDDALALAAKQSGLLQLAESLIGTP